MTHNQSSGIKRKTQKFAVKLARMKRTMCRKDDAAEIGVCSQLGTLFAAGHGKAFDAFLPTHLFSVADERFVMLRRMCCMKPSDAAKIAVQLFGRYEVTDPFQRVGTFCADPLAELEWLCDALLLPFDAGALERFGAVPLCGDSGRR